MTVLDHLLRSLALCADHNGKDVVAPRAIISAADPKGQAKTLEEWLRDEAFEQHCAIFHDRPFVLAGDVGKKGTGILRAKPNIKWDKDRGKEPERPRADYPWFWCEEDPGTDPTGGPAPVGTRWNTTHLTLATKRAARG